MSSRWNSLIQETCLYYMVIDRKVGEKMFADRAKIYIRSGKAEMDMQVSVENSMYQMEDRTVEMADAAEMLSLKWTKD